MAIGVFDSGIGGLSVLKHLKQQLPHESFLYVADSANAPYGNKSESFITQRCCAISDFLVSHQVSAIVIACNTATAAAIKTIRQNYSLPVVAIEPALKPASLHTRNGKVGVLATESTLQSKQYFSLVSKFAENVSCSEQAAHGLVEQIEAGLLDDPQTLKLLRQYIQPMLDKGIDSLVLGCTHYPFLFSAIRNIVGEEVAIIDTGSAIAEQLKRVLKQAGSEACESDEKKDYFYSSGDTVHTRKMVDLLLGMQVEVEKLPV